MNDYRKGSMGAAEGKELKTALIVFSVIYGIILLLFLLPFNECGSVGFFHYYFKNAGWFWKVIGVLSVLAQAYFMWFKLKKQEDFGVGARITPHALVLIVWGALNIFLLAGWKFDLPDCG